MKTSAELDISGDIGPLFTEYYAERKCKMYSFDTPAYLFWQGIFNGLRKAGNTEKQCFEILQSKRARWLMDHHGEALETLGEQMAEKI